MPAAVASRARAAQPASARRDGAPPAKKAKLTPSAPIVQQTSLKTLVNGSASKTLQAKTNGVKNARADRVDDAAAVVSGGQAGPGDVDMEAGANEAIEISSGAEESDVSDSEEDEAAAGADAEPAPATNGHADEEDRPADEEAADPNDLTFGDRLRAQDVEPAQESRVVDVESAFVGTNAESKALTAASNSRPLAAPAASSLGTVLTQALRTNDKELLDSCLRVIDVDAIYATVERLPSPLVGSLLQKLAERLYKKPGRAGMLMVWVQWSLAAHGGYLASQPQLVKQLATLNKVLKERASGLQPLLALKGRLDMLRAQLELRKRHQKAVNDEDDEAVIYVEGEDDYLSSADEEDESGAEAAATSRAQKRLRETEDEEGESSVDEMPTTMEMNEDESGEGSEDSDDLIDDEAEETDDDDGEELSEITSEISDVGDGVSGSEEDSKPARRSTVARTGLKNRR